MEIERGVEVGVSLDAVVHKDGEELRDIPRVPAPADGVGEGEEGSGWQQRVWRGSWLATAVVSGVVEVVASRALPSTHAMEYYDVIVGKFNVRILSRRSLS
jgi:hypothetical protein